MAAGIDPLQLDVTDQEVVLGLQRHDRGQSPELGEQRGLLQLPADEVADSRVPDLAGPYGVVEEAERLLERGQRIPGVRLVQVDRVDLQAAPARVQRPG